MAVYQGTRLRTTAAPSVETSARYARAAAPAPVSTSPRARPMGLLMASIVAATMLALVYLTQTLGSSATNAEIGSLYSAAGDLMSDTRTLQILALKGSEPDKIIPRAKKHKLKNLGDIVVLPAP